MPSLDSCINDIFEPGNIPADPGVPPHVPAIVDIFFSDFAGNGSLSASALVPGSGYAIAGQFAGAGLLNVNPTAVEALGAYQSSAVDSTNLTTYTFASQAIGAASADREVLVGIAGAHTIYVTAVTVGGIDATFVARRQTDAYGMEVWSAPVPTGTTATVTVTWSSGQSYCGIGIATSDVKLQVVDYAGAVISTSANASNVTVESEAGGYIFAIGQHQNITSGNLTPRNLTEQSETLLEGTRFFAVADAIAASSSFTGGMDLNGGATSDVNSHLLVVSFKAKPAAGALWTPAELGHSLRLWLKANEISGTDGSNVSTWEDASGYNHDATSAAQPTLETNELNSMSIVRSVLANSDVMALEDFAAASSPRAGTVLMLVKCAFQSGSNNGAILWCGGDAGNNDHYPLSDGQLYTSIGTLNRKGPMGDPGDVSQWHLAGFRSATNDYKYYFNGSAFFTTGTNTVAWNAATPKLFLSPPSTLYSSCDLAELIMVAKAVSQSEREKLEGYLAHKWGVASVLDAAHPYKSAAPGVTYAGTVTLGGNGTLSVNATVV